MLAGSWSVCKSVFVDFSLVVCVSFILDLANSNADKIFIWKVADASDPPAINPPSASPATPYTEVHCNITLVIYLVSIYGMRLCVCLCVCVWCFFAARGAH